MLMNEDLINQFYKRLGVFVDFDIIDTLVMKDANILRPVIGHAFEYLIADIVTNILGGKVIDRGGDTDIDLEIVDKQGNSYTTQIKTLRTAGIRPGIQFDINLHKTHGLEQRPNNLYPIIWPCPICNHEGEEFPNFLIIPHPTDGILIIPKNSIPENPSYPGHFADPAVFPWNSEWLNRWDLLGFPEYRGQRLERQNVATQPILNNICQKVKLTYEELLRTWLKPSNFRMIDMNLKGNLREPALESFLNKKGFFTTPPTGAYPKYDLMCKNIKIQIKGTSKSKTNPVNNTLGVEVMGTHGNGAIRRYSVNDFDYLGIVIEPSCLNDHLPLSKDTYHFCLVSVHDLPLHYRNGYEWDTTDKLYDVALFDVIEKDNKVYLKPNNSYRNPPRWVSSDNEIIIRPPVHFNNDNIYPIDEIPFKPDN